MTKYTTTYDFIEIARDYSGNDRLKEISLNIGFPLSFLKVHQNRLNKVLDSVKWIDEQYHNTVPEKKGDQIFLSYTLHQQISSDFRSIIILCLTKQNYQANIVMRHLIETLIRTIWADLITDFKGTLTYLQDSKKWKPYRGTQKISWKLDKRHPHNSIEQRLERIKNLNMFGENTEQFLKKYFKTATDCDYNLLFSLPICNDCMNKENNNRKKNKKKKIDFTKFHLDPVVRKKGKEDIHAKFKTDFGLTCCFCNNQVITNGFAMGIPETKDMFQMLKIVMPKKLDKNLQQIEYLYDYLSSEFVHYSSTIHPDKGPRSRNFVGKIGILWGLNGINFFLEIINLIMKYYFLKLKKVLS